jgi:hypothetical protein
MDLNYEFFSKILGVQVVRLTTDDCPLRIRNIVGAGESLGIITVVS